VIDPSAPQMVELLGMLGSTELYVGDGFAALASRSQFNVIDSISGWKVDLIIRKDRKFSVVEFERRLPAAIGGVQVWIVTPEDSILSKPEWGRPSGSERQMRATQAMYEASAVGDVRAQPVEDVAQLPFGSLGSDDLHRRS